MRVLSLAVLAVAMAPSGLAQQAEPGLSGSALIDHHLRAKWREVGLAPVAKANDAEFLRRVYLDVAGVIPSVEETRKFLADTGADKRGRLVDALLKDKRTAAHWADVWTGILVGFEADARDQRYRLAATDEIRKMLSENIPFDEFARKAITASGVAGNPEMYMQTMEGAGTNGLMAYILKIRKEADQDFPKALAGKLTRAFMGVQIQCAQCHDHPFDKWTQEEFYGMASFFTEVRVDENREANVIVRKVGPNRDEVVRIVAQAAVVGAKEAEDLVARHQPVFQKGVPLRQAGKLAQRLKEAGAEADIQNTLKSVSVEDLVRPAARPLARRRPGGGGDLSIPESKKGPIKAAFLETGKGAEPGKPRRETFARYMTEKENVQFARMAVNRYWGHFFGAGIVNPIDDFNGRNKPTHPELLDALAADFVAHGHDLHWLIRAIAGSEAYHLTSRAKDRTPEAERFLALHRVRPLSPEQIMRSVLEVTGVEEAAQRLGLGKGRRQLAEGMAMQFRHAFGDDEGEEIMEFAGTIPSALLMMNGEIIAGGTTVRARSSALAQLLEKNKTPEERIREIFLLTVSRPPTAKEMSRWKGHVAQQGGSAGYEDLLWTMLNTSEFLFNH